MSYSTLATQFRSPQPSHQDWPWPALPVVCLLTFLLPRYAEGQALDSFNPGANSDVMALALQTDGKCLVAGDFTVLAGMPRQGIGRLNPDGSLDATFNPGPIDVGVALLVQPDGKILVGGGFTNLAGHTCSGLGRLNPDGSFDTSFRVAGGYAGPSSLQMQTDGKIVVAGYVSTAGGQWFAPVGRLNPDGTIDSTFQQMHANDMNDVSSLAIQTDGKILVGGIFTTMQGQSRSNLARLLPGGNLDTFYNPVLNGIVYCLAIQGDGKLLVGGSFTTAGGLPRAHVARINIDGSVDRTFVPAFASGYYCYPLSLAPLADGRILIAGWLPVYTGAYNTYTIVRLNADGSLDERFGANPSPGYAYYWDQALALAVQPDGKAVIGGRFTNMLYSGRERIARVNPLSPVSESLSLAGSTITWLRGGPLPECLRTTFDFSSDGTSWTPLGSGARVAGGWQLPGVSLPARSLVRARGYVSGGGGFGANGSAWHIQTIAGSLVINSQPANRTNNAGTTATFGVAAFGLGPISYQWLKDGLVISDSAKVSGSQTSSLTLSNVLAADVGSYAAVVNNVFGSVTSSSAALFVTDPVITIEPLDIRVYAGQGANLAVAAAGTAPLGYQWRFNGENIQLATNAVLNFTNIQTANAGTYSAAVNSGSGGVAFSRNAGLVVTEVITNHPQSQEVTAGTNVSFRVGATGPGTLSYQWQFNGANITNGTGALLVVSNAQALHAGEYRVRVGYTGGSTLSSNAVLVVLPKVAAITTHPKNQAVWQGAGVSFSVVAGGGILPMSYQWRFNSADLPLATSSTLVLSNLQPANAGNYSVVVNNAGGPVVSSNALLTVREIITVQPQDQSVLAGTNAVFSVGTAGLSPLSFQWQFNGSNLPKATNSTLLVNNAQAPNAGAYRVVVTTPYGQVISSQAVLTVVGRAPVILSQPQDRDVLAGDSVTNTVTTTGSEPQTFQWQMNGTNLPSATSAVLVLTNFQAADQGVYRVVVSNAFGFVISSNATLFNSIALVLDAPYLCFTNGGNLRWFAQEAVLHFGTNAMQSGLVGDSEKSFLETTVAGSGVLSYWWRVSSETNADFLRFSINGTIQTNISGRVFWQPCTFRLASGPQTLRWTFIRDANITTNKWTGWLDELSYEPDVAPAFTLQPTNTSIRAGEDVFFTAGVVGTPPPVLQWRCNGTNLPGATNLTLTLTNVQLAWSGCTFQLAASNLAGTTLSSNAVLTVTPTAPMILAGPQSQAVMPGANAAFGVSAIGVEPLRYQWQFEGANLSKATKTALTISNALAANGGSYRVVVSNNYGATFSSNAVLTVLTFPGAVNAGGAQRWTWITGNWFVQTNVTHDGAGAAQSGITLDSQSSVMQTTVVGPGSVGFWWKVSSEPDYDFLKFSTNGVEAASISGEVGWQWVTVNVGPGSQTLRWAYTKDDSTAEGADAGWVDEVRLKEPSRLQSPERLAGGGFRLLFGNGQGWPLGLADAENYEVRASTNLVNWLPLLDSLSVSNGLLFLNDTGNVFMPERFYRVIER